MNILRLVTLISFHLHTSICSPLTSSNPETSPSNQTLGKDAPEKIPGTALMMDISLYNPTVPLQFALDLLEVWEGELEARPGDLVQMKLTTANVYYKCKAWIEPESHYIHVEPMTSAIASKALSVLVDMMRRKGGGQAANFTIIGEREPRVRVRGQVEGYDPILGEGGAVDGTSGVFSRDGEERL